MQINILSSYNYFKKKICLSKNIIFVVYFIFFLELLDYYGEHSDHNNC